MKDSVILNSGKQIVSLRQFNYSDSKACGFIANLADGAAFILQLIKLIAW
jgi:hypothetical protein